MFFYLRWETKEKVKSLMYSLNYELLLDFKVDQTQGIPCLA